MLNFPPYWEFLKINACMFSPEYGLYLISGYSSLDKQFSLHITLNKKELGRKYPLTDFSDGHMMINVVNCIRSLNLKTLKLFSSNYLGIGHYLVSF